MHNKEISVRMMNTLERIEKYIKINGWSNSEFARRLGLTSGTVTEWTSGRNSSYLKHIDKIAEVLNISREYLLCNTDMPSPAEKKESSEFNPEDYLKNLLLENGILPKDRDITDKERDAIMKAAESAILSVAKILLDDES